MFTTQEDGGDLWDGEDDVPGFEELANSLRGKLMSGGPPVDFAAIHLYIAGDLNEEELRRVRERIVTWEAWNRAFWETVAALGDE